MNKSIRWLLTEARLSSINPNKINFIDGKLICYHLTSKQKWVNNSDLIARMDSPEIAPDKEILPSDNKAQRIVKNITNLAKNRRPKEWEIEETVIEDMIYDPYTDTSGFAPGGGDYHGKGLYTCYKFNPEIASIYGDICLVFEIDISNFLITFEDLAKKVHGENWRLRDQLLKFYMREERSPESIEKYKEFLATYPDEDLVMAKSIEDTGRTASTSLGLLKRIGKVHLPSLYDGIILFGKGDGPVCVSFYPKYDTRLIGLGRLNKERPEVVDWYDSLNDFLSGRAKLKQDFETLNAIAEEQTDPIEKEEMKSADRQPFDMDYLTIINFFKSFNKVIENPEEEISTLLSLYEDAKASNNDKLLEFFLESFEKSIAVDNNINKLSQIIPGPKYNELIEEVVKFYKTKNKEPRKNYFINVLEACIIKNTTRSDFFLTNAINICLSRKAFDQGEYHVKAFKDSLNKYLSKNPPSQELQRILDEKLYEIGADLIMLSRNMDEILEFYSNADEIVKNKVVNNLLDKLSQSYYFNWRSVSSQNFEIANELLEKVIDKINKSNDLSDYEFDFILFLFRDLSNIDYFSNKIDEFIASAFLNSFDKLMAEHNLKYFVNTSQYIERKLGKSHPKVLQSNQIIAQNEAQASNDIEMFIENLNIGQITNSQLKKMLSRFCKDIPYVSYLSRQSKNWFSNLCKSIIKNIKNFKVLGKSEAQFILAIIMSQDIILNKEEQLGLTDKFGKSDYSSKNDIAKYKHIDPDVFIKLIGPDLQKGGMGPGLTFKGFEYNANIYRLLYNHRKIVDLFCDVAKPGLMKMIIQNLSETLSGNPTPQHTWRHSGTLVSSISNHYNVPYLNSASEKIKISDAINMDDIAWFEYFISRAKTSSQRGVAKAVASLEISLNDKKSKMQLSTDNQTSDDLDPQLDLSHRRIIGNSLKEVYNIVIKRRKL